MTTLSNWLVGCSTFALIVTSLTFAAESNVVPATLCKASDPSISFDIKSRERGLENVSQINSLNVTCPLPIQMTSSGSTKSNELINVTLFASVNSSDSLIPQCHLTYQTGLRTELILEPSVEDSEGSTEFIWNDIPFGDDVSGYIISCLLTPQSIIETIRISTFANQNDQDLTLGHYCAGAFNPIEFGEEATSFRYLGNDIPLTGKPSGTNFILSGLLNDTPVIANFNLKSDNHGQQTKNGLF